MLIKIFAFFFNILTRSAHKMKQSIIMNVQWDISMPMPCLNGMPIAALNNPFIKAHNWIQAEPSIDSSFSSHKYIPNYHDNTYHHYLLQCRSIGIFCFPKSLFPFFCFRVLSSIPRLTQLQQYFLDGSEEFNILKVVLVPSQKENRVIHRVKKRDSRFINIKIFVLKAGNLSRGHLRTKRRKGGDFLKHFSFRTKLCYISNSLNSIKTASNTSTEAAKHRGQPLQPRGWP